MRADFKTFGNEFLDLNFKIADGIRLWIAIGSNPPFPGRGSA